MLRRFPIIRPARQIVPRGSEYISCRHFHPFVKSHRLRTIIFPITVPNNRHRPFSLSRSSMASSVPTATKPQAEAPWHAAYPAPKTTASSLTREVLLSWMQTGKVAGKDFVLVDLRRADYEGGTIRGSINLPAQTLYPTIPSLYRLFSSAAIPTVIWYCGSSGGRGTRAAAWFADYISSQRDSRMESVTLEGGIKGWAAAGGEYVKTMDGYSASAWK